ncbi:enoyl-[acyl-carrier-protein] reductase [NADH] [Aneurinibacillus soli]|uniref:Enoyl-[acyl-carrier-protein] reductase [NADH] n=1 Tax=Aneurinibacillus soli TaxID=1500254 RepID=A0A0U5BK22_9BACL|nr:enoyl-ACP reductase [Aneurinibacillus soli]PYE62253.1 enoyl-[acyl-carrier-protein] reductase [NADH] [Aneurinibacillus soli]BAU28558.1 Enoyl-[acyl-carrier-protein] reductase [NADH] FabI [Aneurinibacillus soli]
MNELMKGKKGLVLGVANENSIAWHIAKKLADEGAELAFTYQNEKTGKYVLPLFESIGSRFYEIMDITDPENTKMVMKKLDKHFKGELDFVVHSIAGGPQRGELSGKYIDTSREGFTQSMIISVYSLNVVLKETRHMLRGRNASVIAMSYYGSEKVVTNYNVMGVAKAALESSIRYLAADLGEEGIRVNGLSPGTIKTRAASGIGGFDELYDYTSKHAPLKRNVTTDEVANASLFLLSDLSSGITGDIVYVDAGYNLMGIDLHKEAEDVRTPVEISI